jgi:hypothetical protein
MERYRTLHQEFADQTKCLGRGSQAPHTTEKAVDHALPDIQTNIDSRRDRSEC